MERFLTLATIGSSIDSHQRASFLSGHAVQLQPTGGATTIVRFEFGARARVALVAAIHMHCELDVDSS